MAEPTEKEAFVRRRKGRNLALAGGLLVLILLIYGVTLVKQADYTGKKVPVVTGAPK
jgi:hypothetical protein